MVRPFVIVVADDWVFRSGCRRALVGAGCRVATPTTVDAAEYFLASEYPPHVVVFRARERWPEILRDCMARAVRPVGSAVVDASREEALGGAGGLGELVGSVLERLGSEPVAWRADLTLGMELVDAPHRAQVARLAALQRALRDGRRQDGTDRLRELRTDTEVHFSEEEALLQLHGCGDREDHVREHARLLGEIRDLEARWAGDQPPSAAVLVLSLRDSLEGHIRTLDRSLAHCVAGGSIRAR